MTPDTWEPTCTVMTALIIPVASTTSRIWRRITLALMCCGWPFRLRPIMVIAAIATAIVARTIHLVFVFITSPEIWRPDASFVSQRLDGIQVRGLLRRVISKKHTDGDGEQCRNHHCFNGHLHLPFQRLADQVGTDNSAENASGASHQTQHHRLAEELQLNRLFRGAHRHAYSDFARALRHGHEHHVHDADTAYEQRNRGDSNQQHGQRFAGLQLRLDDVFGIANVAIVLVLWPKMVTVPEYGGGFLSRGFHRLLRSCRAQNVVQPGIAANFLHRRRVRHENRVILVLAGNRQPFGQERANDLAGHVLNAHDFPDGVLYAEKLIPHGPPDHTYVRGSLDVVLRKCRALVKVPALNVEIFWRHPPVSGIPVLVSIDDLDRAVDVRRDALNQRHLILNSHGIAHHQRFRTVCTSASAIDGAPARLDPHEILAEAVELLLDARLAGFSNRNDANHGGDPDRDTQDREHTSQFVSQQRNERRPQQTCVIHFSSRPLHAIFSLPR